MNLVYGVGGEMAMGSPFLSSSLKLEGSAWQPKILESYEFVWGAGEISVEGLVFVGLWTQARPDARFRVYLLDTTTRTIYQSEEIQDGLKSLEILGPREVRIWLHRTWLPPVSRNLRVDEPAPAELY